MDDMLSSVTFCIYKSFTNKNLWGKKELDMNARSQK